MFLLSQHSQQFPPISNLNFTLHFVLAPRASSATLPPPRHITKPLQRPLLLTRRSPMSLAVLTLSFPAPCLRLFTVTVQLQLLLHCCCQRCLKVQKILIRFFWIIGLQCVGVMCWLLLCVAGM